MRLARGFGGDQRRCGAVDDSRGVPGVDDAVALVAEDQRQVTQRLDVGVRSGMSVLGDSDRVAVQRRLDGDDLVGVLARVGGLAPAAL